MFGELTPVGGGDPIPLLASRLLVGRRTSCDICLSFPNVSSHHCELELKDGYWNVRDLGSSNGIKVNGERCQSRCLVPGDELQISKYRFRISYQVSGSAPPPDEENPMSMGLLEKAGLQTNEPRGRMPRSSSDRQGSSRVSSRQSTMDDFIMDWLDDD